jgi:lipid-binding SYLF domain-containing protein
MLSCSRSRGVTGGVSLSGATPRPDGYANQNRYGSTVSTRADRQQPGHHHMPEEAKPLVDELTAVTINRTAGQK